MKAMGDQAGEVVGAWCGLEPFEQGNERSNAHIRPGTSL